MGVSGKWERQLAGGTVRAVGQVRAAIRLYGDALVLFTHRCDKDVATSSPN